MAATVTHLTLRLTGRARAVAAVTQALAAEPCLQVPLAWSLRQLPCGRVEIREGTRSTVGSSWERVVLAHLAPPVSLREVTVRGPGRWR